jgi:hypothetical protein
VRLSRRRPIGGPSRSAILDRLGGRAGQFTDRAIRTGYGEHDTAWTDRLVAIATRVGRQGMR